MWIIEARSHDDSDTLDYSGFHVVDPVRLRTTIACQPDDRRRNRLNRHGGFALLQPSGIRNRRWGASSCTPFGEMVFTRIPRSAPSIARMRINPTTAHLAAA